jgi:DNA gyrase/topoisomerase IV subunit B
MAIKKTPAAKKPASVEIEVLEPYQQSRIRTEMWLGSRDPHRQQIIAYGTDGIPTTDEQTWVPALFTAYREVIDNAVDEIAAKGHGDRLDITYTEKDMSFRIADNGRGIPISKHPEFGIAQATLALSRPFAGRNFDDNERGSARGTNGVGASIVNFCSEWFKIDICRDGKSFSQAFHEGTTELQISEPLIMPKSAKQATGTAISFKLSPKVFKHFTLPTSFVRDRALEIALCYPSIQVYFNGEKIKTHLGVEKTIFKGKKPISFDIKEPGFESRFWLLPEFLEAQSGEHAHGLVNGIPVFDGGTHIDAFRRKFYSGLLTAMTSLSKRKKLTPNRADLADGMLIYNITQMDLPSFGSQSKTRLINENVDKIISKALDDPEFFKGVLKRYPEWIESVYERCRKRTQKADDKELAALARKTSRTKVEKLVDATGNDRSKCILLLAEGDSALSGSMSMRDPKVHGGLPLRGKVLNVHPSKVAMKDAVKNEALQQIMGSVGLVPGQRANRHKLRYGKVYITCDADEDGKNIAALIVNFFYQWWPELFEDEKKPFLYVFETPLIVARKGKEFKYWYNDDYDTFSSDNYKGWEVTRAKGLAALKKPDWKVLLADPKVLPITDDGKLRDALDLLFNETRADDRKGWIGK